MSSQRTQRPFSYQLTADDHVTADRTPRAHAERPPQPSNEALEQAQRLREAAAAHAARTNNTPVPRANVPHEEFSYIDTPIDDNTQSFSEAPPHVQEAIEAARASASTPQTVHPPSRPLQHFEPPDYHTQSPYSALPPSQPHPATFAPYAEPQQQQQPSAYQQTLPQGLQQPPQYHQHLSSDHPQQSDPIPLQQQLPHESQPSLHHHHQTPLFHQQQLPYQHSRQPQTPASTVQTDPQPPLTPGPVPLKSEADHSLNSTPTPYSPNPKLKPYAPFSIASPPQPMTPFSPAALHNPKVDLANHTPGQAPHPNMTSTSSANSAWTHSLCACPASDIGTCFTGLFCPCMLYGRTSYRLAQRSKRADATDLLGHSSCNGHCTMFAIACGIQGILAAVLGARVKHAYGIKSEGDWLKSCCCCCCSLIQSEREVKTRESEKARWAGPAAGYVAREGMIYKPGGS